MTAPSLYLHFRALGRPFLWAAYFRPSVHTGANECGSFAPVLFRLALHSRCIRRTGLVNALRGHLAEFGVIAPQGLRNVGKLIAIVRDEGDARLPDLARQVLQVLAA
jgi:hypothetical protein